jgi:hypothetical protein
VTGSRISVSALARRLRVSRGAIQKGAKTGRFGAAVTTTAAGHVLILDADLAVKLWAVNRSKATPLRRPSPVPVPPPELLDDADPETLAEAQRLLAIERTRALRIANELAERKTIDRAEAARQADGAGRIVRERVLNVPDRYSFELAGMEPADLARRLEEVLREGLLDATAEVAEEAEEGTTE